MSGQINRAPPGLLSLFGIKAMGQNPSQMSDTVLPALDVLKFYSGVYSTMETGAVTGINATGLKSAANVFEAQPGEQLLVHCLSMSLDAVVAAGGTLGYTPVLVEASSGRIVGVLGPHAEAIAAGSPISGSEDPFIVPPGFRVGMMVEAIGGGITVTARISGLVLHLTM